MRRLNLHLRTPEGLVHDGPVTSIVAEDRDGWFGVRPGRADLVAVLPPGLLVFRDAAGEAFVGVSHGLLEVQGDTCRVLVREAWLSRDLAAIADDVRRLVRRRRDQGEARRTVLHQLAREALRRVARQEAS